MSLLDVIPVKWTKSFEDALDYVMSIYRVRQKPHTATSLFILILIFVFIFFVGAIPINIASVGEYVNVFCKRL